MKAIDESNMIRKAAILTKLVRICRPTRTAIPVSPGYWSKGSSKGSYRRFVHSETAGAGGKAALSRTHSKAASRPHDLSAKRHGVRNGVRNELRRECESNNMIS
jgi:hypothetical protein